METFLSAQSCPSSRAPLKYQVFEEPSLFAYLDLMRAKPGAKTMTIQQRRFLLSTVILSVQSHGLRLEAYEPLIPLERYLW